MIVVLVTSSPSSYIVGETDIPLEDQVGDRIQLSNLVRMHITENPENPGTQQLHLNPIVTCDSMWLDLRHYKGIGYLKEDLAVTYRSWLRNYQSHGEMFDDAEDVEEAQEVSET